jgi:hypothetical protein
MRACGCVLFTCCLAIFLCGCNSDKKPSDPGKAPKEPDASGLQSKDLVGKWRLVRADGKPPAEWWIKALDIDIVADGTWKSKMEGSGEVLAGMTVTGGGTWSLADGVLSYTRDGQGNPKGVDTVKSQVRVESGHLVVDPDFFMQMRKKSPNPIAAEYER